MTQFSGKGGRHQKVDPSENSKEEFRCRMQRKKRKGSRHRF